MRRPPIPPPPHRGGCLCGAVRYAFDAPPLATVACHCRDCQKLSGATNLLTVYTERAVFRHERGEVLRARTRADRGTDDPTWVVPAAHIWVSRAAPSALIPEGVYTTPQGPADRAELIAAFKKAYEAS
jgi:hypothetical protein